MIPVTIQGYYKSWSNPLSALYVEARVELPRLGVSEKIGFLVDTGADVTCLHPTDLDKMGVPLSQPAPGGVGFTGVGGALEYYREDATLYFETQDGSTLTFYCQIYISQDLAVEGLPSLLGRDFLNRCRLLADNPENQVLITPANVISGVVLPA